MNAELLMIGTELLLGQIQDTNATYLAQTLAAHGMFLYQKTTVGDNPERIREALEAGLRRADVVLCSGGLGPTEDDITRECVAEVYGRPLVYQEALFEGIRARFAHLRAKITENNKKQAMVPEGAIVLENPHGTAPGILIDDPRGIVACMPGVPWELKPMFEERVLPYLRKRFGMTGVVHYRVLKVCGVGESRVDAIIGDLILASKNPTIGLLASPDAVRIRITAHAETPEAAQALIVPVEAAIRERLPGLIMGVDDETLEGIVAGLLAQRGWNLATVETLSGGALADGLTSRAGDRFLGGWVLPGEGPATEDHALDMARRSLLAFEARCTLVLLADPPKKRSLVLFASPAGNATWEVGFYGDTEVSRKRTAVVALEYVRRFLSETPATATA